MKLTLVLIIFSFAFLLRGSFDLYVTIAKPTRSDLGMGEMGFALFLGSFYFVCEVLPLFVVFLQHQKDFGKCELEMMTEPMINKSVDMKPGLKNSLMGSTQVTSLEHTATNTTTSIIVQNVDPRTTEVLRNDIDDGAFDMKEPGLLHLRSVVNNLRQTVPDEKFESDLGKKVGNQEPRIVYDDESVDESIDSEAAPEFHDIS